MKKFIIACICSMFFTTAVFAQNVTVTINDTPIAYLQQPIIKNGTTFVPMKQTMEALGAVVSWNNPTKTAIARKGNTIVSACQNSSNLIVTVGEKTQKVTLTAPAYVENGSMMVPLRPLLQAFQIGMTWDNATSTANINMSSSIISEKTDQKTIKDTEGNTIWKAAISYPELQGNTEAIAKINQTIKNDVYTSLSATENEISMNDFVFDDVMMPYTLDCTYSITYLDDNIISFLLDYYELTGGAHGMPYREAYTFDLNTGERLQLKDILNTDADAIVKSAVKNSIQQHPDDYFPDASETVDSEYFVYGFYIQPEGIHIFTPPYLLEPYANHYQIVNIDKSQLQNLLKINIDSTTAENVQNLHSSIPFPEQ